MFVTPAATAYLLTHRLSTMMIFAAIFASLSGIIGLYLSFYWSIASGAAIVLTATVFFLFAFGWKKIKTEIAKNERQKASAVMPQLPRPNLES